jgi:hypothetical protein
MDSPTNLFSEKLMRSLLFEERQWLRPPISCQKSFSVLLHKRGSESEGVNEGSFEIRGRKNGVGLRRFGERSWRWWPLRARADLETAARVRLFS